MRGDQHDVDGVGDAGVDDLPGEDEQYDDLDEITSIGLGILQELTLIRQELQAQRLASADLEGGRDEGEQIDDEFVCASCGGSYETRREFKQHAIETHNAPREEEYWSDLLDDTGGDSNP